MFKIEVTNFKGQLESHLWQNNIEDDFLRFLPNQFGVPKENFTIYKFLENVNLANRILKDNENNFVDLLETGKADIKRKFKKQFDVGEKVEKTQFENIKTEAENCFSDLSQITISIPTLESETVNEGQEDEFVLEFYTIPEGHILTTDIIQTVQEYVGIELQQWPYDEDGNFLGNN